MREEGWWMRYAEERGMAAKKRWSGNCMAIDVWNIGIGLAIIIIWVSQQ